MHVKYSAHAEKRMKQREITELDVQYILEHHKYLIKSKEKKIVIGELKGRTIRVIFAEKENYINIVTVT